jgi:protein-disulfide isomerase
VVYKPLVGGSEPLSGVYHALECAADHRKAIEFHFGVLANTSAALWRRGWLRVADSVGVGGSSEFVACLERRVHAWRLDDQLAEAKRMAVPGTPTPFVNGHRVVGAASIEFMESLVRLALKIPATAPHEPGDSAQGESTLLTPPPSS